MKADPCSVCNGTEFNLLDGFYYCIECGTQDVNLQETVVEHTVLADGTFAFAASRKITTFLKDGVEMSGEWHKWHTFNFILSGLVEEVIALGGSLEFKNRVLWIWTRYMKRYVNKELMERVTEELDKDNLSRSKLFDVEDSDLDDSDKDTGKNSKDDKEKLSRKSIVHVTKTLLIAIIYVALNFDRSDIQLSHLCRFIREGRISIHNFKKFVPKEMNFKSIPNWRSFLNGSTDFSPMFIRDVAMTLIKKLDLGKPVVPDLRKLVHNYLKELCLPNDFKNLIYSLMYEFPFLWDFVRRKYQVKDHAVSVPDYEGVTMSYILVAMKICFGLDDEYDLKVSKIVESINQSEDYSKSHKLGKYSNPTERLFSFREWCNFVQFRKTLLSKYCLLVAREYDLEVDDQVFMGQLEERPKKTVGKEGVNLVDEVTMDIINKLKVSDEGGVIPRSEFSASLTPLCNYTEVVLSYIQSPDLKLLLSEDFTQYCLKYACEDFKLLCEGENIIKGICDDTKIVSERITSKIDCKESDFSMVFIRNCENKHWLTTKPPTIEHLTKVDENDDSSKDADNGYSSNLENTAAETGDTDTQENLNSTQLDKTLQLETIKEEERKCIFDDDFNGVENSLEDSEHISFHAEPNNDIIDNDIDVSFTQPRFNPETFDREKTIKELILLACKTHKIPIPNEYKEPMKRRNELIRDEAGGGGGKRRKTENALDPKGSKQEMNKILSAYYSNLSKDMISKVENEISCFRHNENVDHAIDFKDSFVSDNHDHHSRQDEIEINKNATADIEAASDIESSAVDLMTTVNPDFDDKTHEIEQLYIQFKDKLDLDDFLEDFNDPEIDKIIDQKIAESRQDIINPDNSDKIDDLIEELPRSRSDREKALLSKIIQNKQGFHDLIQDQEGVSSYKYWLRHYNERTFQKTKSIKEKFDTDLKNDCSLSFNFVIKECASLLSVTSYSLYRRMQQLEQQFCNYDENYTKPKRKRRSKVELSDSDDDED